MIFFFKCRTKFILIEIKLKLLNYCYIHKVEMLKSSLFEWKRVMLPCVHDIKLYSEKFYILQLYAPLLARKAPIHCKLLAWWKKISHACTVLENFYQEIAKLRCKRTSAANNGIEDKDNWEDSLSLRQLLYGTFG